MSFVRNITNKTIPISEFNNGNVVRIFEDVKSNGSKVVLKDNSPECVLISPDEYNNMIDAIEDLQDSLLAIQRLYSGNEPKYISQEEFEENFEKEFGFKFNELEPLDESEFE